MAKKSKMIKVESPETGAVRLALYTRVSTDKQREEGYSLDVQEERLRAYAQTMGNVSTIELYTDDGFSGGSLDRPAIQRLINDVKAGHVTHVVVVKLDRLSRSQKDTLHLIEDIFIPNDVAFISIQESFNTNTPFGRAMIGILSVFAQLERENIYERTRSGMQKRVEAGLWPGGGHAPFGYDYDEQKGILIPNADAEKVRYLYDQYLSGASLQKIADDLGLQYEKVAYNILTRKTNAGYIVYNGVEYKGQHEAIIPLETYRSAMALLNTRSKKKQAVKTAHLLAGYLICGVCGAKMRYQKWGPNRWKIVCYSRQKSKQYLVKDPNCNNEYVDSTVVEAGVIQGVFASAKSFSGDETKQVDSDNALHIFQQQLEQEMKKLKRLYNLYAINEDEILLETIREIQINIKGLEVKIREEESKAKASGLSIKEIMGNIKSLSDIWDYMSIQEKRAILSSMVDKIIITHGEAQVYMNAELM